MVGKLFVVSACSGAGKTTLVTEVINRLEGKYNISRVITYTSKTPRVNDVDGKDYYFISSQEFELRIKGGFFLEWSAHYGNYYGSPVSLREDLACGKSFIVITDLKGAEALAHCMQEAVLIWIYVQDLNTLKTRLFKRNTENIEQIKERLRLAQQELDNQLLVNLFKHNVLNDDIEKSVQELLSIITLELKNS